MCRRFGARFSSDSLASAPRASRLLEDATNRRDSRCERRQWGVLSPAQIRAWREQLISEARALANRLPIEEPVDLMDAYARPLCLFLAAMVTRISRDDAETFYELARRVSASAAEPFDPTCVPARSPPARICGVAGLDRAGFAEFFFHTREQAGDWRGAGVREVQRAVDTDCPKGLLSFDATECTWCPEGLEF